MHVLLSNNKMLNLMYTEDIQQGFHDKKLVVIYLTNGTKIIENFKSESDAEAEVSRIREAMQTSGGGLSQADSFSDLPEEGSSGTIYITKDNGQTYYWDKVTGTYIATGESGRTGIYAYNDNLPTVIGEQVDIEKSKLDEILKPSSDYKEGSEVIGLNHITGVITKINSTTVTVKSITDSTTESFREVETESSLPATGIRNTLYYIKDISEFRIWDVDSNKYKEPIKTIMITDAPVADAKLNTLYVDETSIKYTSDNSKWNYLASETKQYEQGKMYHKGMILYYNNTLVKVAIDGPSDNTQIDTLHSFVKDIEGQKLEVLIDGTVTTNVKYDITNQLDGIKQIFSIDKYITSDKAVLVFYAGQLLVDGVNYTIDFVNHRLVTLFPEAPDAEEGRHLIIITGDISTPTVVRTVRGEDEYLVDNSDPSNPVVKHDSSKIDKSITEDNENFIEISKTVVKNQDTVEIVTTSANVNTGRTRQDKIVLKSSDGNTKFEVEDKGKYQKDISITTIGNTEIFQNVILFNGVDKEFVLPNNIDTNRPILVIVNGITLTSGQDNDYVIEEGKIKFALTFETSSNNMIINFK